MDRILRIRQPISLSMSLTSLTNRRQAGMAASNAYKMNLGGTAIAFVGTILSWFLMARFGRRTIYLGGMIGMTTLLFITGFLALAPESNQRALWGQAAYTVRIIFSLSLTTGFVVVYIQPNYRPGGLGYTK